jgi:predicted enzyme related to lactoylglutathione lyase
MVGWQQRMEGTGVSASIGYLVIDSVDPTALAPFWCALLDVGVDATIGDGEFLVLTPTASGLTVGFQKVSETKAGKNRLHLDLIVDDLEKATADIQELGGQWLEPGNTRELEGFEWRCMADPEGNEFDIDTLPPSA